MNGLNRLIKDLKSPYLILLPLYPFLLFPPLPLSSHLRNEPVQRDAATDLVRYVEAQERDLSVNNLELFWGDLNRFVLLFLILCSFFLYAVLFCSSFSFIHSFFLNFLFSFSHFAFLLFFFIYQYPLFSLPLLSLSHILFLPHHSDRSQNL